jgi:hypothetical protein
LRSEIHECLAMGNPNQPSRNQDRSSILHEYLSPRAEFSIKVYQQEIRFQIRLGG